MITRILAYLEPSAAILSHRSPLLVTMRRVGATVVTGAIGEIEKVSQVFQPDGRLAASNSPYPFRFR